MVGSTGAGKTTLAREIADRLDLEHIELDSIHHQAGWCRLPVDELRERTIDAISSAERGWVMCGGYDTAIGPIRIVVADTIIWLDLPRRISLWRTLIRTLKRVTTRQELWNGNRETAASLLSLDPEKNIVLWSWVSHAKRRNRYQASVDNGDWDHLTVHHLKSRAAVEAFKQAQLAGM